MVHDNEHATAAPLMSCAAGHYARSVYVPLITARLQCSHGPPGSGGCIGGAAGGGCTDDDADDDAAGMPGTPIGNASELAAVVAASVGMAGVNGMGDRRGAGGGCTDDDADDDATGTPGTPTEMQVSSPL